jgi:hypothetical protein
MAVSLLWPNGRRFLSIGLSTVTAIDKGRDHGARSDPSNLGLKIKPHLSMNAF